MAKKSFNVSQTIGANATVNVLDGSRFQNVAATGLLTVAARGAATGLLMELFVSDRNSVEDSPCPFVAAPQIRLPDDIIVDDVECFAGERIQLNVQNTTGAGVLFVALLILDDNVAFSR